MDFWQTKVAEEQYDRLAKDLGVIWDKADYHEQMVEAKEKKARSSPERIRLPLAMMIAPGIKEILKNTFGSKLGILPPKWAATSEFVELYDNTDKDQFLNFVRSFVRPKVVGK